MSYKRVSWRPIKNYNVELVSQRLDYINFYVSAVKSGYKIIQVDEFNVREEQYPTWLG